MLTTYIHDGIVSGVSPDKLTYVVRDMTTRKALEFSVTSWWGHIPGVVPVVNQLVELVYNDAGSLLAARPKDAWNPDRSRVDDETSDEIARTLYLKHNAQIGPGFCELSYAIRELLEMGVDRAEVARLAGIILEVGAESDV